MAELVTVRAGAGQGEEVAQGLLGDPRGQQCLSDLPLAEQGVPHLCELLGAEVPPVTQQLPAVLPPPQNTGAHPKQALLDAGYCSETNLEVAKERQLGSGTDTFMATGRLASDEQVPPAPRVSIPANATLKERMARKLRTKPGKAAYSRRVEPVFGQIMTCHNGRQLLLRGEDGARGGWRLLAACHNLRKTFRHVGTAGLAAAIG